MNIHIHIHLHMCIRIYTHICVYPVTPWYGVATVSRIKKIQVSFAEYSLFYRALLQKRPMI